MAPRVSRRNSATARKASVATSQARTSREKDPVDGTDDPEEEEKDEDEAAGSDEAADSDDAALLTGLFMSAGVERFEVQEIVDTRVVDDHREFLVRWKGYAPEEDTWEPAAGIDADVIAKYYGWPAQPTASEKFTYQYHPKKGAAQPDWRRKNPVGQVINDRPKYKNRFTPDSAESEEGRGWKAEQQEHDRHSAFRAEMASEYEPGPCFQPAADAPLSKWADLWLPREVWKLESTQSNLYAGQKIRDKIDQHRKPDCVDECYLRMNGFTPDSCKLFYCIQILIHQVHSINYDTSLLWGDDPTLNMNGWVKARMARHYYHAHCRYLHYEDNEDTEFMVSDAAAKTRELRELLQQILRENFKAGCDLAIDETSLDTESHKVFNRQRLRFKPSCNEGVLYDMLSDSQSGYCLGYEESRSDPSGEFGLVQVTERLTSKVRGNRECQDNHHIFVDSRYNCPEFLDMLEEKNFYGTGTVDKRRVGLPKAEIQAILDAGLEWGEWTVLSRGNQELVIWRDRNICMFLTSGFCSKHLGHVVRKETTGSDWIRMTVPYVIQAYNQEYDGVDHTNQILKSSSTFGHVRVLRFPRKQASFFKDINLSSMYIAYRLSLVRTCGSNEALVEKTLNSMSKIKCMIEIFHSWGDELYFREPDSSTPMKLLVELASLGSTAGAAARRGMANVSVQMAIPGSAVSTVGVGHKRQAPTTASKPGRKKKQAIVHTSVTVVAAVNASPSDHTPIEEQRRHTLANMYSRGMKGGRPCVMCNKGAGHYSKGGVGVRKLTGYRCILCERYMCAECYLLFPKHAGFVKIFYEVSEATL